MEDEVAAMLSAERRQRQKQAELDSAAKTAHAWKKERDVLLALQDRKNRLFLKIGGLIRGDWSGTYFDGRDVLKWIVRVVESDRLDELEAELDAFKDNYT